MNYYNENDPYCVEWLKTLIMMGEIPDGYVDERSIADVRAGDLVGFTQCHFFAGIAGWACALKLASWPSDREVWTGSCPCQPFSLAGKQKGFSDDRHLWPEFKRLIAERRPSVVFGEQVASATQWLSLVRSDLETLDYAVGAITIEAASAGADHLRNRFWFVADDGFGRCAGSRGREEEQQRGAETVSASHLDMAHDDDERSQGRRILSECADQRVAGTDGVADTPIITKREQTNETQSVTTTGKARAESGGRGFDLGDTDKSFRRFGNKQPTGQQPQHDQTEGADYIWVTGADGKARRVKPGIRLLAHGVPSRVAKLRALGNAIDPRPAAAFITAFKEVKGIA